jgi:hypothetical protein
VHLTIYASGPAASKAASVLSSGAPVRSQTAPRSFLISNAIRAIEVLALAYNSIPRANTRYRLLLSFWFIFVSVKIRPSEIIPLRSTAFTSRSIASQRCNSEKLLFHHPTPSASFFFLFAHARAIFVELALAICRDSYGSRRQWHDRLLNEVLVGFYANLNRSYIIYHKIPRSERDTIEINVEFNFSKSNPRTY